MSASEQRQSFDAFRPSRQPTGSTLSLSLSQSLSLSRVCISAPTKVINAIPGSINLQCMLKPTLERQRANSVNLDLRVCCDAPDPDPDPDPIL